MATGTTADAVIKRNRIIELALRACRAVKPGQAPENNMMRDGVTLLNEILREEDADFTGDRKALWAMNVSNVFLAADRRIYSTTEGLASDIQDIESVVFRDSVGADTPIKVLESRAAFEALSPKDEIGDVECILFERNRVLASQSIIVWPLPNTIGTDSNVVGSDALNYLCIKGHTSTTETKPITGSSYRLFWRQAGSGGGAWATATEYTNSEIIRIAYKRPLYDFDLADDDPDMPLGWGNYLKWRLAVELASTFKISVEEQQLFNNRVASTKAMLFPATRNQSKDYHNKASYF